MNTLPIHEYLMPIGEIVERLLLLLAVDNPTDDQRRTRSRLAHALHDRTGMRAMDVLR